MRQPFFDRLRLRGVRCFADAEVPLDPRVTVIIGENGAGKTTVAEALASLTGGEGEGLAAFPLRHGAKEGRIELFEAGSEIPAASWVGGVREERRRLPEERYLFAYGRYRRVQFPEGPAQRQIMGAEWDAGATEADLSSNLSEFVRGRRTTTLFMPDGRLLDDLGQRILHFHRLRSHNVEADAAWRALDGSVRSLGHGLDGITVIERERRDVPVVSRRGLELSLRELSDGYQAILVIVLDLLIRYAYLPPILDEPQRRPAMVVIDEVDLHLHPRWQRRVVRQLTRLFPETQFILTTHSPAVVQGAIDFGHKVVVLRESGGAAVIAPLGERARRALRGAQLGSVLVDDHLFGVASRYSSKFEAVEQKARQLRKKLEAGTATEKDRDELIKRLDRLEELMADEEERWAKQPLLSELAKVQVGMLKRLAEMEKEAARGGA